MSVTSAPPRPTDKPASNSFASVLWAEWIKLRTVRGWIIALVLAAAATFFLCYETAAGPNTGGCSGLPAGAVCTSAPRTVVPTGPGGEGVADTYEFVHRTLTRDGTVTAEITSLAGVTATNASNVQGSPSASHPGLASWAKAGLLLTPSTTQGSAYAAVMATGSHGIRFQYDFTHDTPGVAGTVTTSTPRWLRLVRSGDTITGYASTNGTALDRSWLSRSDGTAGHGTGRALRHLAPHVPRRHRVSDPGYRHVRSSQRRRQLSLELVARTRASAPVAPLSTRRSPPVAITGPARQMSSAAPAMSPLPSSKV